MQHLLNQLPDEQLLDIFVLIEDQHQQLAIEYLIRHAQFSQQEAIFSIEYLIQQRRHALKRYIQEDRIFLKKSAHHTPLTIEAEDDFLDEFIINLDFSTSKRGVPLIQFKKYYASGRKVLFHPTFIYLIMTLMMFSLSYTLYMQN